MKKLFLGMGIVVISISTYALDLQSHEVPRLLNSTTKLFRAVELYVSWCSKKWSPKNL